MAEGIANHLLPMCTISSAGIEAHGLNPIAAKVMSNISIPIFHHKSKKIKLKNLDSFDVVITLCGNANDTCLSFKIETEHIHWDIEDPANFIGNEYDKNNKYSEVRDIIFNKISDYKDKLRDL